MDPQDVSTLEFNYMIRKIREFCYSKNMLECCVQHRKSYAAMCEDPSNVMTITRKSCDGGVETIPAPQTGQMQLEREMQHFIESALGNLFEGNNPKCFGFFALNYSYRDEEREDPLDSLDLRYRKQFPMFEVELACDFEGLIKFITELLEHLGFPVHLAKRGRWVETAKRLGVKDIDHEAERRLGEEAPIFFLTHFPLEKVDGFEGTDPFWNMARDPEDPKLTLKVDVLFGKEALGCAQRSCNVKDMRKRFFEQGKGQYHKRLFYIAGNGDFKEGEKKVMAELEDYWARPFITRSGFGMGWQRTATAMKKLGLFPKDLVKANLD